jgi:hypothetical protein
VGKAPTCVLTALSRLELPAKEPVPADEAPPTNEAPSELESAPTVAPVGTASAEAALRRPAAR